MTLVKGNSLKRQQKEAIRSGINSSTGVDLPHHQAAPFKNYIQTKAGVASEDTQFVGFQPIVAAAKSRGKEIREKPHQELQDPAKPSAIYKSTRSQAKRVLAAGPSNSSTSAVMKGLEVSSQLYAFQGTKSTSQSKIAKATKNSKTLTRGKVGTPAQADLTRRPAATNHMQLARKQSGDRPVDGVEANTAPISSEYHQTEKMPSLAKMN